MRWKSESICIPLKRTSVQDDSIADLAVLSHIGFKAGTEDFYPGDVTVESSFLLFMIFAWNLFYVQMLKIFAMKICSKIWLLSSKTNDRMP